MKRRKTKLGSIGSMVRFLSLNDNKLCQVNHAKENPSLAAEMKTQPGPKKVPRRGIVQRSSLGSINKESGGNCKIELMDMSHPDPGT